MIKCRKCKSTNIAGKVKGNAYEIYCMDCGAFQKWGNKDDRRIYLPITIEEKIYSDLNDLGTDEISNEYVLEVGLAKPTNYTALFPDIQTTAETLKDMIKCGSCPIYRWCTDQAIDADEAGHDEPKCISVFVKWLGSDYGVGRI